MPSFEVASDPTALEAEAQQIQRGLREFNASRVGDDFRPLRIVARDDADQVIGGLVGATYWGWLHIETLWVGERHRRLGHGRRMLELAESEALARNCRNAFLDTFSFQARPLYERLGYRVVGTIEDFPPGHERHFLIKRLAGRVPPRR
jgi:ribosomal protein S18 acetylase RimI-like enzyme